MHIIIVLQIDVECAKCWSRVQFILTSFWSTCCQNAKGKTSLDHDDFELSRLEMLEMLEVSWSGSGSCFMLHLGWNPPSQTPEIILNRFRFQPLIFVGNVYIIWCLRFKRSNTPVGTHRTIINASHLNTILYRQTVSETPFISTGRVLQGFAIQGRLVTCLGAWLSSSQQT